jgi:serine/threonine-protein kinase RsbW
VSVEDPPVQRNEALLIVRDGPLVAPVLTRVVGMLAARAQCPIDRLDDALLLADAVAANGTASAIDGRITVRVVAERGSLELDVGPLRLHGARDLVAASELPGVGNVLERVADEVTPEVAGDGDDEHLLIRLGFPG